MIQNPVSTIIAFSLVHSGRVFVIKIPVWLCAQEVTVHVYVQIECREVPVPTCVAALSLAYMLHVAIAWIKLPLVWDIFLHSVV